MIRQPPGPSAEGPDPAPPSPVGGPMPSRSGSPQDYKYASTRLHGGESVISQDELLRVITAPGAGDKEVTEFFTFWRPHVCGSRKSTVLHMTNKQQDIMYALAGCIDVIFLISRVKPEVRRAVEGVYGIDKANLAIWYKNRGRNPSKFCHPDLITLKRLREPACDLEDEEEDMRPVRRGVGMRQDRAPLPPVKFKTVINDKTKPLNTVHLSEPLAWQQQQPEAALQAGPPAPPAGLGLPLSAGDGSMSALHGLGPGGVLRIQASHLPGGLLAFPADAAHLTPPLQQRGSKPLELGSARLMSHLGEQQRQQHEQQQNRLAWPGLKAQMPLQTLAMQAHKKLDQTLPQGLAAASIAQMPAQGQQLQPCTAPASTQLPWALPPGYQLVAVPTSFPSQQLLQLQSAGGPAAQAVQQQLQAGALPPSSSSQVQLLQRLMQAPPAGVVLQLGQAEQRQAEHAVQPQLLGLRALALGDSAPPMGMRLVPGPPRVLPQEVTASSSSSKGSRGAPKGTGHSVDQPVPAARVDVKHEAGEKALATLRPQHAAMQAPGAPAAAATAAKRASNVSNGAGDCGITRPPSSVTGASPAGQRMLPLQMAQLSQQGHLVQVNAPGAQVHMRTAMLAPGQQVLHMQSASEQAPAARAPPTLVLGAKPGQAAGGEVRHWLESGSGAPVLVHRSMPPQQGQMLGLGQQGNLAPMQSLMINGQQVLVAAPTLMQAPPQQQAVQYPKMNFPGAGAGGGGQMLLVVQQGPDGLQVLQQLPMQQQQQQQVWQVQPAPVQQGMQGQDQQQQQQVMYQVPQSLLGQCCVVQPAPQGQTWAQVGGCIVNMSA